MTRTSVSLFALLIFFWSCVGTDFINDPSVSIPARIELTPNTAAIPQGSSVSFQATYYDTLGNIVSNTTFQWTSSDQTIAAIDENGSALGNQPGQVMILAATEGIQSDPALLTVVADPNQVATVVVTPGNVGIGIGDTLRFEAMALNLSGAPVPGKIFTWNSSDPSIANIDDDGLAIGISPGTVGIIASTDGIEGTPSILQVNAESRTGMFTKRSGTSYNVEGTATLKTKDDGSLVLEFGSDFSTSNGPGVVVFLSTRNSINSESLNLGDLISTSGKQSYGVPNGIELNTYDWVVIHCLPFNVTFGFAELK